MENANVPKSGTERKIMAKLNTSYLFSEKKKCSIPMTEIPKNLKEALNIDAAYPDGIFKIEPGEGVCIYDKCYIFEDINYTGQDEKKKNSTLTKIVQLFKSMKYQFKICVSNEQGDIHGVVDSFLKPLHEAEYSVVADGIGMWINQKIDEGTRDIRRLLYLVVTCRARNYEDAKAYFLTTEVTLGKLFASLRSSLYQMSPEERFVVLQKLLRAGDGGIVPICRGPEDDSWKNQILPVSIVSGEDCMQINAKYMSVLFAQDYDATLDEEKVLHSLTDSLFPIFIALDFEPVSQQLLTDKLITANANNEQAITFENERNVNNRQYGKETSYGLRRKKKELENLMDRLDKNDEEGLFLSMLVCVPAESMEELESRVETLCQLAEANGYTLKPCYHMQLKALNSALPVGGRQFNYMRSLLTSSAVAWQPFRSKDLQMPGGYVYGLNRRTRRLIIANRKKLKNPHAIIGGHSGSGKSVLMKMTEISQTLLFTDDDILCIDPNNELMDYVPMINGSYFDMTPQSEIYLNPLWVPRKIWDGDKIVKNRFIGQSCDFTGSFVMSCMMNMAVTQLHLNLVSKAVREVFEEYFAGTDYDNQPHLGKVWSRLRENMDKVTLEEERKMLLEITDCMEQFVSGEYDMFAHPSNIDMENRLVAFGLRNIPQKIWETVMLTLIYYIRTRVMYNQEEMKASHFIIDETQVLCKNAYTATELLNAVETYRKYGGIITLLFQNFKHAIENPDIRDMLSNSSCKIFFDQGGVDAADLALIQELSQDEYDALSEDTPGYGLFIWDTQVYKLDARIDEDNVLWKYIDTDFHKRAEEKEEEEKTTPEHLLRNKILTLLSAADLSLQTLEDMCVQEGSISDVRAMLEMLKMEDRIEETQDMLYRKK